MGGLDCLHGLFFLLLGVLLLLNLDLLLGGLLFSLGSLGFLLLLLFSLGFLGLGLFLGLLLRFLGFLGLLGFLLLLLLSGLFLCFLGSGLLRQLFLLGLNSRFLSFLGFRGFLLLLLLLSFLLGLLLLLEFEGGCGLFFSLLLGSLGLLLVRLDLSCLLFGKLGFIRSFFQGIGGRFFGGCVSFSFLGLGVGLLLFISGGLLDLLLLDLLLLGLLLGSLLQLLLLLFLRGLDLPDLVGGLGSIVVGGVGLTQAVLGQVLVVQARRVLEARAGTAGVSSGDARVLT